MPKQNKKPINVAVGEDGITYRTKYTRKIGIAILQFQFDKGFQDPHDAIRFLVGNSLDNLGYPKEVHNVKGVVPQ